MAFQDFFISLIRVLVWLAFVGFFTIVIGRALWIRWNKRWKFTMKYKVLKAKVDPVRAEWIIEALERGINQDKMKMKLLVAGFKNEDVSEMVYLAKQMQLKLGIKIQEVDHGKKNLPSM